MARTPITKLSALGRQLEAAIYLILRRFPPEPIHTLIGASRGLLYGLHQNKPNAFLSGWEEKIATLIVPGKQKEWNFYQNRATNFLKHADRDPDDVLENVDLVTLNDLEIMILLFAYWSMHQPLSPTLTIGLIYGGLQNEGWIDFAGLFAEAGLQSGEIDRFRSMSPEYRRDIMLEAFERSIDRNGFSN